MAYKLSSIFRLTYKTLENINNEDVDKIDILFIFFQLQYLRYLGYDPSIKYCVNCNTKLLNAIFDYTAGKLLWTPYFPLSANKCEGLIVAISTSIITSFFLQVGLSTSIILITSGGCPILEYIADFL